MVFPKVEGSDLSTPVFSHVGDPTVVVTVEEIQAADQYITQQLRGVRMLRHIMQVRVFFPSLMLS